MPATRKESAVTVSIDPWMSIPDAAREIGVANATVLHLALRGEIKTMVAAKRTLVERESVMAYKARIAADSSSASATR
jgi:hypothetical protein